MKLASSSRFVCSGLWRWVKGPGLERFDLLREAKGWTMRGTIIALVSEVQQKPFTRGLVTPPGGRKGQTSRSAMNPAERTLRVIADNGRWFQNGQEKKGLLSCIDLDLGWSPSTKHDRHPPTESSRWEAERSVDHGTGALSRTHN